MVVTNLDTGMFQARTRILVSGRQKSTTRARAQHSGSQPSKSMRLRVERQTHLPASRQEAWQALRSLLSKEAWEEHAPLFAALESIYRAECQGLGEQLQAAYQAANEALEELPALEDVPRSKRRRSKEAEAAESRPAVDAFRNDIGAAGTTLEDTEEEGHAENGNDASNNGASHHRAAGHASGASPQPNAEREESQVMQNGGQVKPARWERAVDMATSQARSVADQATEALQEQLQDVARNQESIDEEQDEDAASGSIDESEVVGMQSVDYESASRLDFDRSRHRRISLNQRLTPQEADHKFMTALVPLLRKASFVNLSPRDDALATSLNADYVAQLFISPDTRRLDSDLVQPSLKELDVPEQADSILIFKRGYGQARRKGRMLVAKLDYLQYIVVRSVTSNLALQVKKGWQYLYHDRRLHKGGKGGKDDVVDPEDKKVKPTDGRMPTTAGQGNPIASSATDESLWQTIQSLAKRVSSSGKFPPRLLLAGGGLFMTLSNWGLLPQVDVEPLSNFKHSWKPDEPERLDPVFVERTSLRDALAAKRGLSLENVLGKVELIEPTFQELLVVYRRKADPNWLSPLRRQLLGPTKEEQTPRYRRRGQIWLRIFRDVPLPTWKIVFPDKLLQFRPLEGLRADLLTVAGIIAFIAQAKYDSIILELITLSSAVALLVRVTLGYKRMSDRFEKMTNQILAETTIAGQEGVITYLSNSAALQQFEQTSLAYLMLERAEEPLGEEALCTAVEDLLEKEFQVKVRFDSGQALAEVERLGLAEKKGHGFTACNPQKGLHVLQQHWNGLLLPNTN